MNRVPSDCLMGVVEGPAGASNPIYWAASGQFLFLLGVVELLLPPLGSVAAASFCFDEESSGSVILGAVASTDALLTVVRICVHSREVSVVASCPTRPLSNVFVVACDGSCDILLVGRQSDIVGRACVTLQGELSVYWFEFPSTLMQRLSIFGRPTARLSTFDYHRKMLTTLDTSGVLRSWDISDCGSVTGVASGAYTDPLSPISLCPAGPEEAFLFLVVNKHGGRDIFLSENWFSASEVLRTGQRNELVFRRQVLAPDGCDAGLLAACYVDGVTVYVFGDRIVSSSVAPAFVDPDLGCHEVVDTMNLPAGSHPMLIGGSANVSVLGGDAIYTLTCRDAFSVFADMLLDEPVVTVRKAVAGLGRFEAASYVWRMLPSHEAIVASQELASPQLEGNTIGMSPFVSVAVSQLSEMISSFSDLSRLVSLDACAADALDSSFELFDSKFEMALVREGWCDSTYADQALLELDVGGFPFVVVSTQSAVDFSLASSVQGLLLARLRGIVSCARAVLRIWARALAAGVHVNSQHVSFGPSNWCSSDSIRQLCLSILGENLSSGLVCLSSLPAGTLDSLPEIVISLRILSAALQESFDESLDLLSTFSGEILQISHSFFDSVVALLIPLFSSRTLSAAPLARALVSKIAFAKAHESASSSKVSALRLELETVVASISDFGAFEAVLQRVAGWLASDELPHFVRFLESFSLDDGRLEIVGRVYRDCRTRNPKVFSSVSSGSTASLCLSALGMSEPMRSAALLGLVREQAGVSVGGRLRILAMCNSGFEEARAEGELLRIQSRLLSLHPSPDVHAVLRTRRLPPTSLFALCAEAGMDGFFLQVSLLKYLPDVDPALVSSTLSNAVASGPGDASHFCSVLDALGDVVAASNLSVVAAAIVHHSDPSAIVTAVCGTGHARVAPSHLFHSIDSLIHELEGTLIPGVVTAMFEAATAAKDLIVDTGLREQCSAILENRAARILQAAEFGLIILPTADQAVLATTATGDSNKSAPVALYTEGTVAF